MMYLEFVLRVCKSVDIETVQLVQSRTGSQAITRQTVTPEARDQSRASPLLMDKLTLA
jgi:hypothetical protein